MNHHYHQVLGPAPASQQRQRVLLVDDDRLQLKLSALRLRHAGFIVTTASSALQALDLAMLDVPDAIISDVIMGELDGFGLCRRLRAHSSLASVPILLLSAHYSDAEARQLAASLGAAALVARTPGFDAEIKALRSMLGQETTSGEQLVARDVTEQHLRSNANQIARLAVVAKSADDRYRALFENANDTISFLSRSGVILEANERWRVVLGVEPASLVGKHLLHFAALARERSGAELDAAIERGSGALQAVAIERPAGGTAYLDFSITVIEQEAGPLVLAIGRDVTARFLAACTLAAAEEKYRSLVERIPDVVWTTSRGLFNFVTGNIEALTGFSAAEIYAADAYFWRRRVHPDDQASFSRLTAESEGDEPSRQLDLQYRWRRKDGSWAWLWHRTVASYERGGVLYADGLISDITQRKQLEESLRQSQKMDALGQLTGGIAHDFNNILAVILGNSQFLIEGLPELDPRLPDALEIRFSAERAASLTRQLLAFSRRQVLEFEVTDLNRVVTSMERLLRRLIGADIQMSVVLADDLGRVRVDTGQIEQVLMNLAINGRDAMPQGGRLTIETMNATLDASSAPAGAAGHYVVIAVTDTGLGMDAETQRRVFEPFFTTKELGKGTGLGLAICHGIINQSGGQIALSSELGCGSTFQIYLPCLAADVPEPALRAISRQTRGTETVLLVEDDPPLRKTVKRMLLAEGYKVLLARAGDALEVAKTHGSEIALLLTDVVMPIASGPEVAEAVKLHAPQAKVLFMSGYTDHGVLPSAEPGRSVNFIQKPFSPSVLAKKVRDTLDG
jgi:two-component system cell cycle sensor histidine kinase/response regulator CckA